MSTWELIINVELHDKADPEEMLYEIERSIESLLGVTGTYSKEWQEEK